MALEHELFDDLLRFVIQFPIAENRYQITNAYRRALDERDAALARAEAAERRVAELEAMLLEVREFLAEYYGDTLPPPPTPSNSTGLTDSA